jgi:hypothetical protein
VTLAPLLAGGTLVNSEDIKRTFNAITRNTAKDEKTRKRVGLGNRDPAPRMAIELLRSILN